jgi:hypothetical protein
VDNVLADPASDDPSALSAITRLFNDTRKRLVETGTRNRLVHVNRANARGNVINIINERSDNVYAILHAGKVMRFLALGSDKDVAAGEVQLAATKEPHLQEERRTDEQLETRLGPDALQKKLLKIAREAQTAEEESGVNILYLALGFLTWFEDKTSALPREAPLLLVPVELVRNMRTSAYDLRLREEDVMTNLPLQARLKDDFGIDLPEVEIDEEWSPSQYLARVAEVVVQRERWSVNIDAMQLGFFSFSKLLMFRDLAIDAWPQGALATHDLTRGLLYEGFPSEASLFGPADRLDEVLPPSKLFHVVDADASQAKVIEEVRSGRNLVVQGPPGTGKSQTITNIIAAAAKEGKRVLFVAEKMAALSVVHERLVKVGLRDVCLELHSRNANKKTVPGELARTLSQGAAIPAAPIAPIALTAARDQLNQIAETLHQPIGMSGETPFSVLSLQSRLIGLNCPPPRLDGAPLASVTRDQEQFLLQTLERYGALVASEQDAGANPFEGVRNLDLQPVDLARLELSLRRAETEVGALLVALSKSDQALAAKERPTLSTVAPLVDLLERLEGRPAAASGLLRAVLDAPDLARLKEASKLAAEWRVLHDAAAGLVVESAFTTSVGQLRAPLVAGTTSFFARWGSAYRRASRELAGLLQGELPKSAGERLKRVDTLLAVAAKKAAWEGDRDYCSRVLGDDWRGDRTDFAQIGLVASWCDRLTRATFKSGKDELLKLSDDPGAMALLRRALREAEPAARSAIDEAVKLMDLDPRTVGATSFDDADLNDLRVKLDTMASATGRYGRWSQLARAERGLERLGLHDLALRMKARELDGHAAGVEVRFARAETLWRAALQQSAVLRAIGDERRHELVATFAKLERQRLAENVLDIRHSHLNQLPQGAMGEMKIVRGEIGKKRGHIALRRLFKSAGTAVQRIKPVLLMSPISIAQFLPPGSLTFDLLVIDEASQVRPEDALGAVARAKQIVVVGDKQQLPPSSFFDRLLSDDEDHDEMEGAEQSADLLGGAAKLGAMESILTLCEARGLGSRMLTWHYRSRDPSLIAVSNREFYKNGLILPPSPLQEDPAYGLCFSRVDGVYDKGGKRDNRKEGEAIVARVAEHARKRPSLSLGIVTFSFAQRNLITELLELARRSDNELDSFLREGQAEDVFVKNIENVQGDERDVILVSVGYGPAVAGGRLSSMSFGPVNAEGGERRLNVLFTRARVRCEVFASFDPGDIDVSRTSGEGPRILKRFLDFAKNGKLDEHTPTGLDADTPFEEDVADIVRSFGYLADPQVGSAGFRIDIGVRHPDHPGRYVLAIECDGATYHSALWARERDRLRQDVLEHLGWRFHRIWSTDWFYNRHVEIERLRVALAEARDAADQGIVIKGANEDRPSAPAAEVVSANRFELPEVVARQMPIYRRAHFPTSSWQEPHDVSVAILADLVRRIVDFEGPIHGEEVARRLAACFGKEKAGGRIIAATTAALRRAQSLDSSNLLSDGAFWFTRAQSDLPPVRDRSGESGATLKAACISMLEITAALKIARDDNAGGDDTELIRTAARLLGFRRVGPDLQARLRSCLSA